jgi:Protein of unknown function (DUF998)
MSRHSGHDLIVEAHPARTVAADPGTRRSRPRFPTAWPTVFGAACVLALTVGVVMLQGTTAHAHRGGFLTASLAAVSLASTVAYVAIMAGLHALPTGYNPIRHAVSDYGVGRYTRLFTVALYVSSVGVIALAFAVLRGIGTPPLPARDIGYLLVIPLARIGMTLFPTSLEGQRVSRTGLLHYVCAVAAFTFTYLAISGMTPALRALDGAAWARGPLGWTEWIIGPALALVVVTMLAPLRRVFGLFERVFLLSTNVWFALAAGVVISRLS